MDIRTAPAKPLFLLTAVLYAGMAVALFAGVDGEPSAQHRAAPVTALIDSLPPTAAGPAHVMPPDPDPSSGTARRDCPPLVAR